jgi:hypothetical protein
MLKELKVLHLPENAQRAESIYDIFSTIFFI